tara:strand:- start:75 stop:413 length:339 start_codon:yes stop_codon:yes gene_type:complete
METKINTIDRAISKDGLDDVCTVIHYSFIKSKTVGSGDDAVTYSASSIGTVGLDAPDPDNFTAYADITEEDAVAWCEAKIGAERMTEVESSLDAQIAEQETPTRAKGLPWSS